MVLAIGNAGTLLQVAKRSHAWGSKMNWALVRLAALTQGAVDSKTTAIPGVGTPGQIFIHPANNSIYVWVAEFHDGDDIIPAQWYVIDPTIGTKMYVRDVAKWFFFNQLNQWQLMFDPAKTHRAVPREFSFYNPYLVRPSSTLFSYVATQEWVIEANAPGSGSHCEIAPTGGSVVYTIHSRGPQVGTITFAAGSTNGVISFPAQAVVLPTVEENQYEKAHAFQVRSPSNTRSMEGLHLTICGKIRSID